MLPRSCLALVLAAALAGLTGCGDGARPGAVPAGGKVMFRKTVPAVGALVVFHPTDPAVEKRIGGKPFATVKDDGTFALTTHAEGDGAPEGEYGVTIDWRPAAGKCGQPQGEVGPSGPAKLNPRYSNPQQPFTKVTVKKGDPNQFTFDVD